MVENTITKNMKIFCFKICLFFVFLTFCNGEAEIGEKAISTTSLPVDVQNSETKQSSENEISQYVSEKPTEAVEALQNKSKISNDIEVFKENNGSHNEKQEEEPAGEDETPADAEEPKNEETEAVAEPEPAAEEESEAPAQAEGEEAAPAEEETPADAEPAEEPAAEPEDPKNEEAEAVTEAAAEEVANTGAEAAGNDEAEMPKDEPAKEDENSKPDLTKISDTNEVAVKEISCFTCSSNEDVKCPVKASKQITCPKINEGDKGKHNGCYTLYKADTNITMRGCVDDLAEEGLKYCLTNEKLCILCYTNSCNDKPAPSTATKLKFNIFMLLILNMCIFFNVDKIYKF